MTTYYYFAGRYASHPTLSGFRDRLEASGDFEVISTWINGDELEDVSPEMLASNPGRCWEFASTDLDQIDEADVIVSFTEGGGGKGGRHIEHGYFLASLPEYATRRRAIVVGPREHIFHCHPRTEVYPDFEAFLTHEIGADHG